MSYTVMIDYHSAGGRPRGPSASPSSGRRGRAPPVLEPGGHPRPTSSPSPPGSRTPSPSSPHADDSPCPPPRSEPPGSTPERPRACSSASRAGTTPSCSTSRPHGSTTTTVKAAAATTSTSTASSRPMPSRKPRSRRASEDTTSPNSPPRRLGQGHHPARGRKVKTIEILLGPTGEATSQTEGFAGPACREAGRAPRAGPGRTHGRAVDGRFLPRPVGRPVPRVVAPSPLEGLTDEQPRPAGTGRRSRAGWLARSRPAARRSSCVTPGGPSGSCRVRPPIVASRRSLAVLHPSFAPADRVVPSTRVTRLEIPSPRPPRGRFGFTT